MANSKQKSFHRHSNTHGVMRIDLDHIRQVCRNLFEASPLGIVAVDSKGEIIIFNAEAEKTFGYKREEVLGKPIELLVPDRLRELHIKYRDEFFSQPSTRRLGVGREIWARRKDGSEFLAEIGLSPFMTKNGIIVAALVIDVTECKQLDQMKDEFLGMVSHELRNPVGIIQLQIDNLRMDTTLNEKQAKALSSLATCTERLTRMTKNLLDLSRLESGKISPTMTKLKIEKLINEIFEGIEPIALKKGIGLKLKLPVDLPEILADHDMIYEVLLNLLSNAIRFAKSQIILSVTLEDDFIKITVSDDGSGIEPKQIPNLFTKFGRIAHTTTARGYKGTGLGLTICNRIVTMHGGRIWAESTLGVGTQFHFTLPNGSLRHKGP